MSSSPPMPLFQPVLTAEAMREADRFTIEDYGLPSFTLMETAGRGAAAHIADTYAPIAEKTVCCLCGKGNNGGDGFVVARQLHARGAQVRVVAMSEADDMSDDAARNAHLLQQLAEHDDDRLTLHRFDNLHQIANYPSPDLYVDALLGTGLTSELREPIRSLVAWLNEQPQPTVALDVPTGLHSDKGCVLGHAAEADLTVTMAALKAGLLLGDGPRHTGRTEPVEIGIPAFALEDARQKSGCALRPTDTAVRNWLPERASDAHKYSAGLALVVAGSPGLTGAPVMASSAAARAGAGAVVCACQERVQPTLAHKMTEVMTLALPESGEGGIAPNEALEAMQPRMEKTGALLVGPGLGRRPDTQQFVRVLLDAFDGPVVIDADGLNALADDTAFITKHADGRWILTPHVGEFKRLAGADVDLDDRIRTVETYADRWNSMLLLKGMPSLIATPGGTAYVNATGNSALATAGTGDVLAGLCTGLLAQGLTPEQAAVCALHLGGAAADRYAAHRSGRSMLATDLFDELPKLLHERFGSAVRYLQI